LAALPAPDLDDVRRRVRLFGEAARPDRSYAAWVSATRPRVDLSLAPHRHELHRWLNAWGCRIRWPVDGDVDHFDASVGSWWERHGDAVKRVREPLARLTDRHIAQLGAIFDDLGRSPVAVDARGTARTMGSTAAAKALYALRPRAVMPWDQAIATQLYGGRDGAAFARHLALGRDWARALLEASGLDEPHLVTELGRPGASLAKVLDEYCFVRFTLGR
jgi:hypothetical protein